MTFSLLVTDAQRRFMVAAAATKTLSVGASVMALRPRVGGVLSQALTSPELRGFGLENLAAGLDPKLAIEAALAEDNDPETRQIALMSVSGKSAVRTGSECLPLTGGVSEEGFAIIGNLLSGTDVIQSMRSKFRPVEGLSDLSKLAMEMMLAGESAGGDSRGLQSAAILGKDMLSSGTDYSVAAIDIRVDEHAAPLQEINRILKLALAEDKLRLLA